MESYYTRIFPHMHMCNMKISDMRIAQLKYSPQLLYPAKFKWKETQLYGEDYRNMNTLQTRRAYLSNVLTRYRADKFLSPYNF
jgi:hypothetical protein